MLTLPTDLPRLARRARWAPAIVLALALPFPAARAAAAPQPAAPAAPAATAPSIPTTAADRGALRRDIERLYEVLPTHDGVLLRPRSQRAAVRTIEVTRDGLAVNGTACPAPVLREWIGAAQADPVIRLTQLDPASRRALFDLKAEAGEAPGAIPPPVPTAPSAPAAPPTPEATAAPAAPGAEGSDGDEADEPQGSEETAAQGTEAARPARRHAAGSGSIVRFADSVVIAAGENPEQVTALAGSVTVDGEVSDDVTAVGGSCTINGRVGGSVTAVGGSVHLGPHADVGGDITSVGGVVERAPGARVRGSVNEVSALAAGRHRTDSSPWIFSPFAGVGRLVETLTKILVLALLVCLMLLVARPAVERIALRVGAEPWRAGLAGLLSQLAFGPIVLVVTVVLAITIIGCALFLLYPFILIALLLAGLAGFTAVAYRLGGWAEGRFGWRYTSPYVMALTGVALIEFLPFLSRVIGLIGPLHPLAVAARALGFLGVYLAWTVGFGAVLLDFLAAGGFRQWRRGSEPAAPVAPIAPAPPVPPPAPPATELPPAAPPTPADPWETR